MKRNVNLHAAYILIAGLVIWAKPNWRIVDPLVTILFASIVFYSTLSVIRALISILLEEAPPTVSWDSVFKGISSVPGVSNVHCLHVWSISHGQLTLSVHASASDTDQALVDVSNVCKASLSPMQQCRYNPIYTQVARRGKMKYTHATHVTNYT